MAILNPEVPNTAIAEFANTVDPDETAPKEFIFKSLNFQYNTV